MKRGDLVLCALSGDYGKPRPALVVQSDLFNPTHSSVSICPLTSDLKDAPAIRLSVHPRPANGLEKESQIMIDKVTTTRRERIGPRIGSLTTEEMSLVDRALKVWFGLEIPKAG